MRNRPHRRLVGLVAALVLVAAPLALATAAFADDPGAQSTATVANGQELRTQWAIGENTLITLTANVDLGLDGNGKNLCDGGADGEPVRSDSDTGAITIDGQGLYGITQTCDDQRVLRDDAGGETVTLQGLTHFTGGDAEGHGGGLRNDGPVVVVNSDVSGNNANAIPCGVAAGDANAQAVCDDGDGGGIYAGEAEVDESIIGPGYDITLTNTVVANNQADDDGGGVYTEGTLTATGSQFTNNTAFGRAVGGGRGGGAFAGDEVSSTNTSWEDNEALCGVFPIENLGPGVDSCGAVASGGGFFTYGSATVTGSTFTNNHAYDTGGGFLADDAVVTSSTFTGNNAGGESEEAEGVSATSLPAPLANHVAASAIGGSHDCLCVGGGFAVGTGVGAAVAAEGDAQVTGSTFIANGAGCDVSCLGSGGGFFSGGGATVTGSTFGDPSDPENGSNAAGCFESCGAFGGGFYSSGDTNVDTSTFVFNGNGCLGGCGAEGGGFFAGNGLDEMSQATTDKLPDGAGALLEGDGAVNVVQSTFTMNEAGCIFFVCGGSGGGFFASANPTVNVTASTFNDNDALWDGGAISVNGGLGINVICEADCGGTDVAITNSTVTGNTSGYPAAISVAQDTDTLTLVNDTIDSNTIVLRDTTTCAAACSAAEAKAQQCECYAANVIAFDLTSFGTDITHPLLDEGAAPVATFDDIENCWYEDSNSDGYNFSDDDSCGFGEPTDNVADGNDPMLGALANNGGPTQTMLPLPGSPLIDAIQPISECQVDVDQRGVTRPQIKGCDTGAVEVLGASLQVEKVVTGTAGNPVPADGYSFAVTCTDGSAATLTVADATNGGSSDVLGDILPGATCSVVEDAVVYTNPLVVVQPTVTYDPVSGSPLGEGETSVVTVTNNYDGINLLGALVNITPKFTG